MYKLMGISQELPNPVEGGAWKTSLTNESELLLTARLCSYLVRSDPNGSVAHLPSHTPYSAGEQGAH